VNPSTPRGQRKERRAITRDAQAGLGHWQLDGVCRQLSSVMNLIDPSVSGLWFFKFDSRH
jgi:hypothetical protein